MPLACVVPLLLALLLLLVLMLLVRMLLAPLAMDAKDIEKRTPCAHCQR